MSEVNTKCTSSGPRHCGKYSWCAGCYAAELRARMIKAAEACEIMRVERDLARMEATKYYQQIREDQ